MEIFRKVNDDVMSSWIRFRENELLCHLDDEDKKHVIQFEEICKRVLKNVDNESKKYVEKQLELLDKNFMDYLEYWNEKYYRCGFVDGVQLISGCSDS